LKTEKKEKMWKSKKFYLNLQWIITHLTIPKGGEAELAWLVDP